MTVDFIYFLIIVGLVIGSCPPETGIYLMLKGQCISNGTYFKDTDLQIAGNHNGYIHCVLPNQTLDGGQWLRPDGQPVNCTDGHGGDGTWSTADKKDPFLCTDDSPNANITLYLTNDDWFAPKLGVSNKVLNEAIETEYKCCLPTNCSDPHTNIMTINVFERIYITDLYVDLPSDITVIPQYYTVHCIVTGVFSQSSYTIAIKHYYDDDSDTELNQSYCDTQHDGYTCSIDNTTITTNYTYSNTRDYTVTVEWEAKEISSGVFTQSAHDGDHIHYCEARARKNTYDLQRKKTLVIRAPCSSPSNPTLVSKSLTSIIINWTYPNISDVDGYVVNASSLNDYVTQQVNGSSVSQTTLNGLLPGTTYNITVRAYQDILGPASDTTVVTTTEIFHTIDWSRTSSITNLLDTQYSIQCITSNIHPTMIYWTVNGLELHIYNNTNYTLVNESNMTYNSTLLLYLNNELGRSVSVTCSVEGVSNETVILKAPIVVENITIETVNSTSVKISWTVPVDVVNGFIVYYAPNGTVNVFSNSTYQTVVSNLLPGVTYCVIVYAYKDLLSANVTTKVHISATSDDPVNSTQNSIVSTSVQQTKSSTTAISSSVRVTPTLMLPSDGDDTLPAAVAAGGAAGGGIVLILAVVIVVVLLFITLRRRSKDGKKEKDEEQQKIELNVITEEVCTEQANAADVLTGEKLYEMLESKPQQKESADYVQLVVESPPTPVPTKRNEYESIYATPADVKKDTSFDNKIPTIHPVKKEEFWSYVTERDIKVLQREYRTLYTGEDRRADVGFSPTNKAFNRFRNIIPYDDNRVVLQKMEHEKCDQDFINASFIDGYSMARKFIATQGPLKSTMVDFMRMIWQEKVQVIVMVTNLWEGGKIKCEQYWPSRDETKRASGPFTVRLRDQSIYPEYTLRTMEIKLGDETRHVIHYQLTSWPDHGVLEYPTPLILVHKRVMNEWHSLGGPLLIHCSAGVGRTGTFITLDMALEQINKEGKVDIAGIVTRLREQRIRMVQTEEQYIFIHDTILEVLTCGDTEITSNTFLSELEELKQITDPQTGETSLQTQFRILSQVTPSPDEIIKDTAEAHPDKNRSEEYLPADKHIVPLQERGRYINASFVGAYSKLHGLIIAQSPMENTAEDFWKMILQYRVSAIVMCCNLIEEGEEVCHRYWPSSEEPYVYGRYEVCLSSEAVEEGFIQRSFIVETHDKETRWSVKQFQITDWLSDGIVRNPAVILQVIECVTKVQQKSGGGPVVVHCSDTVGCSGVFCAASNAIEQCKTEGLVDVFLTVKSIRMKKPGAVYTLEQYTSVYDTVATFLTSNEAYANFL